MAYRVTAVAGLRGMLALLFSERGVSLFFALGIALLLTSPANASQHQLPGALYNSDALTVDELIAIPDPLKAQLDRLIAPIGRQSVKVAALHQLLFSHHHYGIQYQNDYTKTAQSVVQTRSGNCVSLAALYVGAARHLGLKAKFQLVKTPDQWDQREQFNVVLGHVNVLVEMRGQDATVEVIDTFTAAQTSKFRSRVITDEELLARYFNNRGAEILATGQLREASQLFEKATATFPTFADAWVNLGVARKLAGDYTEAEAAYLRAYKYDRRNFSALSNLHTLYREQGETEKAAKLAPRIRQHNLKNPYYLAQLSEKEAQAGDLKKARQQILKAIDIHPAEPSFYTQLGEVYYRMGKLEAGSDAFKTAIEMTTDSEQLELRKKKFDALNRAMMHKEGSRTVTGQS